MLNIANWDMKPISFILFFPAELGWHTGSCNTFSHPEPVAFFKWKKLNENGLSFCKLNFHCISGHSGEVGGQNIQGIGFHTEGILFPMLSVTIY